MKLRSKIEKKDYACPMLTDLRECPLLRPGKKKGEPLKIYTLEDGLSIILEAKEDTVSYGTCPFFEDYKKECPLFNVEKNKEAP